MADEIFYPFVAVSGGTSGAMDAEPVANLAAGYGGVVVADGVFSIYVVKASGDVESLPTVVKPDDAGASNLRWHRVFTYEMFSDHISAATHPATNSAKEWTAQQNFDEVALTISGGAVAWDLNAGQAARLTLTQSATISAPSNQKQGGTYTLEVIQNGTGGYTLAFNAAFKFANGITPDIDLTANHVTIFTFKSDGTYMRGGLFFREEN